MKRWLAVGLWMWLAWCAVVQPAVAQFGKVVVHGTSALDVDGVHPGDVFHLAVTLNIDPGYHIQSHVPSSPDYIATELTLQPPSGLTVHDVHYPDPQSLKLPFEDKPLSVYSGKAVLQVTLQAASSLAPGPLHVTGSARCQACSEQTCLPPIKVPVDIDVNVVAAGAPVKHVNADLFANVAPSTTSSQATSAPAASPETDSDKTSQALANKLAAGGIVAVVAIFGIFVQGLLLTLTPCVYPLIPITMSFFASQASDDTDPRRQRIRTFALAATYVLGMCTTYSLLGVVAAKTGHLFGSWLQSPLVLVFVAIVFFALSLSMMGVYELTVPSSLASKVESKKGVFGALFMGLFVGIVAAPCIGPFVIALFALVGSSGNAVLGFWLFFTLALGMGMPFLLLGWFSGSTRMLPRSGAWMVWVKKVLGLVMMGIAVFYIRSLIPTVVYAFLLPAFIIGASIWVGFFEKTEARNAPGFVRVKRGVGIVGALAGVVLGGMALTTSTADMGSWAPFNGQALDQAAADSKPAVLDFSAKWCTDCSELDAKTYSDAQVQKALAGFVRMKVDLTDDKDPAVKALYQKYDIKGLPTVIFLARDGHELKDLRLTGFEPPAAFLQRVAKMAQ